jgi:hypothetical protein
MRLHNDARIVNAAEMLSVIAGSLLVIGSVAFALFAGPTLSEIASRGVWAILVQMLPRVGGATAAPEIDAGSIGTTIALLTGGILLLGGLSHRHERRSGTRPPARPKD